MPILHSEVMVTRKRGHPRCWVKCADNSNPVIDDGFFVNTDGEVLMRLVVDNLDPGL